ncbi:MAG TPA: UDP-N-acetylmuramoyl-L-alanine--D-glutamate ligase [Acidimicrobiales bacterium]|jgi:UDP-N-acetylmuramoylalanine--D-glutamate ligase|nr:UDP-N-acetylmuramoyl-L-alanine--D-glutamate ligase [Acidimicrobiales bacterium]
MRAVLIGFGITNQAVADGLLQRGHEVVVCDDEASASVLAAASARGVELVESPGADGYERVIGASDVVLPSPGIGDVHLALGIARRLGVPVRSEFDLAAQWDDRPVLAITGTDGKTTVTMLVTAMLQASGLRAAAAGNTEVPLVAAIQDPAIDVFVVEASSFRIDHSERFAPHVGTWLNFSPDHLNLHRSLESYELAKAKLWRDQSADDLAVGSLDDATVRRHLLAAPARHVTFGLSPGADFHVDGGDLVAETGDVLAAVDELPRHFPHDLTNDLAAAATALAGGATVAGCHDALVRFEGLPHRISLVAERDGVRWYDDSKATTPNATLAATSAFDSVVLIAGGQNKGLDLGVLAGASDRVRAVVAIGDAAGEVEAAFTGVRPVVVATSMSDAVKAAREFAQPGDAVLLSPACASFDWYRSYGERGDDFTRQVRTLIGPSA